MGRMERLATNAHADVGGLGGAAALFGRMSGYVGDLQERVRLLEAVIENFPGGISLFDDHLQMVLCNQRQREMLDYPDDLFSNGYPTMEALFRFNAARGEYGPGDPDQQVAARVAAARAFTVHETLRHALDKGQELTPDMMERLALANDPVRADLRRGILFLAFGAAFGFLGLMIGMEDGEAVRPMIGVASFPVFLGLAYMGLWAFGRADSKA